MRQLAVLAAILLYGQTAAAKAPARMVGDTPEHWGERVVHVTLDPSLASLGAHAMDDVRAAFGTWLTGDPGLPTILFDTSSTAGAQAHDRISRILATRDVALGHEKDVAYTVSWASTETGLIEESDIVFNLAYPYTAVTTNGCAGAWDVGAVATHEAGHFFGLDEDMTEKTTTMWYRTESCDAHKRTLTTSDVGSMESIYEPVLRAKCSYSPGPARSGALWIAAPIIALYMRRRRRS